ncbi:hypothetical protein HYPSUDRAFT_47129 [Hypholoma sublateritium FD-334 SS-4]|uniref:ubiquitinyl hydrolase 1 n=1 Tax=Hypholoma sublateritium (strain FD-334 SS-4) TaxID=945553 RepID=A0A0D2M0B9_HYPSF|nr:hypothetical protein HYPSUDRAFT_47129 [Hypholoma sublateritium FD-334 SS-4]
MAKPKTLTPQEVYRQRRQREEREKNAYLPPGLINHGNTCFMNSVLQGLIATRVLSDLVLFAPIPQEMQMNAASPIVSRRSPQLTNGHNLAGSYEQPWVNSMPIGDMFLTVMYKAWDSQAAKRKDVLSPKPILAALGQKYDQYLDFAQQDAHEFLRILLDAMRMEEQDIIKKRQPPSPPKKRRRTTITSEALGSVPTDPDAAPAEPPLLSFADMIFGGELTSILVCQKCKHVSQTYEEFNDISLSIKAEDYFPHNRKRDRFKKIVGRLTQFPGTSKPHLRPPITHAHAVEMLRSSSVPPSPRTERDSAQLLAENPRPESPRRRSLDVPTGGTESEPDSPVQPPPAPSPEGPAVITKEQEKPTVEVGAADTLNVTEPDGKHVEFVEPTEKKERHESASVLALTDKEKEKVSKSDDMGWVKLGRRISLSVGLGRSRGPDKDKDRKDRDRKSRSMDRSSLGVPVSIKEEDDPDMSMQKSHSASAGSAGTSSLVDDKAESLRSRAVSDGAASYSAVDDSESSNATAASSVPSKNTSIQPTPSTSSIPLIRSPSPQLAATQFQSHTSNSHPQSSLGNSIFPGVQRSKSPKPPKPNAAQTEYLRKILADVSTSPSIANPFALFKPPLLQSHSHHHSASTTPTSGVVGEKERSSGAAWLGMGRSFSGIEECLRLFTAVEVLDGENMVGCRQCWKIQNGVLHAPKGKDSDADDDDDEAPSEPPTPQPNVTSTPVPAREPVANGVDKKHEGRENSRPPLKLLTPPPAGHIPTSLSTPTVSTFETVDDSSDARSVSSLPSDPISIMIDDASQSSLSLSTTSDAGSTDSGVYARPGGMPIPKISTTAPPDTPTDSTSSAGGNSQEPGDGAGQPPAVPIKTHPRFAKVAYESNANVLSKDSLSIPPRSLRRSSDSDVTSTDNDSSDDESDASVDTTVSAESSASRRERGPASAEGGAGASTSAGQVGSTASPAPSKKPSKPKPVIMRPAYKRYLISTPPPILVIHLKRFQQTAKSPFMSFSHGFKKLDDYISFPEYLDLLPFLAPRKEDYGLGKKSAHKDRKGKAKEERCMYRLYAVVVHIGNMLGGHYVAYTALPADPPPMKASSTPTNGATDSSPSVPANASTNGSPQEITSKSATAEPAQAPKTSERQWAHISDTTVRLTTLEEVLRAKAYICMYERC